MYCQDHWRFQAHSCPNEQDVIENRIVPECPLCGVTVPLRRGQDPNVVIDKHISQGCKDPGKAATSPVYTNACHMLGCKRKEVVPFRCKDCQWNYCIKHRSPLDHDCQRIRPGNNIGGFFYSRPVAAGSKGNNKLSRSECVIS